MKQIMAVLATLILASISLWIWYRGNVGSSLLGDPTQPGNVLLTPTPTGEWMAAPNNGRSVYDAWIIHESEAQRYSMLRPDEWSLEPYDEENTRVLGTNVLYNYDLTLRDRFTQKGVVDWSRVMPYEPAIKVDFTVRPPEDFVNYGVDPDRNVDKSNQPAGYAMTIGTNPTTFFEAAHSGLDGPRIFVYDSAPSPEIRVLATVYVFNHLAHGDITQTHAWEELRLILASFTFRLPDSN